MINFLFIFINIFFTLFNYILISRVILSWFNTKPNNLLRFIFDITDPVLRFSRKILPPIGFIDFSPLIAFLIIDLLRSFIIMIFNLIF